MNWNKFFGKLIVYSIFLTIILNLVLTVNKKFIPCGTYCWGGTFQWGLPYIWYEYGVGDVITGAEWMQGIIFWGGLILDIIFWWAVSFIILFIISIIKIKVKKK